LARIASRSTAVIRVDRRGLSRHAPCTDSVRVSSLASSFDPSAVLDALGAWAPFGAVLAAVVCGLFCFPLTVVAIAAGALFGPREGLLVAGATVVLSGLVNFVVARHLWRSRIESRLRRYPRVARLDAALAQGGGRVLALLRLSPVVPWAPVSYAAGLSCMRLRTYALTCLAMVPLALLYARIGAFAGELGTTAWARVTEEIEPWALPLGMSLVLIAAVVALQLVARTDAPTFLPHKDATR
jgi:uncharacterized membrane protein YdjX (TVP38/TMEM64 family)